MKPPKTATSSVTFDADGCTVSGHPEVAAGLHFFILKSLSDASPRMVVVKTVDGKTAQDLLDLQSSQGADFAQPDWTAHANTEATEAARFSFDTELTEDERAYAFTLEQGEHAIVVGNRLFALSPTSWSGLSPFWVCSSLQVT